MPLTLTRMVPVSFIESIVHIIPSALGSQSETDGT
jgi:hypothetical protein